MNSVHYGKKLKRKSVKNVTKKGKSSRRSREERVPRKSIRVRNGNTVKSWNESGKQPISKPESSPPVIDVSADTAAKIKRLTIEEYHRRIVIIMQKFQPKKVSQVPNLLAKYPGREYDVYVKVCNKYKVTPLKKYNPAADLKISSPPARSRTLVAKKRAVTKSNPVAPKPKRDLKESEVSRQNQNVAVSQSADAAQAKTGAALLTSSSPNKIQSAPKHLSSKPVPSVPVQSKEIREDESSEADSYGDEEFENYSDDDFEDESEAVSDEESQEQVKKVSSPENERLTTTVVREMTASPLTAHRNIRERKAQQKTSFPSEEMSSLLASVQRENEALDSQSNSNINTSRTPNKTPLHNNQPQPVAYEETMPQLAIGQSDSVKKQRSTTDMKIGNLRWGRQELFSMRSLTKQDVFLEKLGTKIQNVGSQAPDPNRPSTLVQTEKATMKDVACQPETIPTKSISSRRLASFLKRAEVVIEAIVNDSRGSGSIQFGSTSEDDYLGPAVPLPPVEGRKVTQISFSPDPNSSLVAVGYSPSNKKGGAQGLIVVWSISTRKPRQALKVHGDPQALALGSERHGLVFAGLLSGSIALWDMTSVCYTKNRPVTFQTGFGVDSQEVHMFPIVAIRVVHSTGFESDGTGLQVVSLDEGGCILVWTTMKLQRASKETDSDLSLGLLSPGGRIKLLFTARLEGETTCGLPVKDLELGLNGGCCYVNIGRKIKKVKRLMRASSKKSSEYCSLISKRGFIKGYFTSISLSPFLPGLILASDSTNSISVFASGVKVRQWNLTEERGAKAVQWCMLRPMIFMALTNSNVLCVFDLDVDEVNSVKKVPLGNSTFNLLSATGTRNCTLTGYVIGDSESEKGKCLVHIRRLKAPGVYDERKIQKEKKRLANCFGLS